MSAVTWGLRWSAELVVIPQGANAMEVPCAQRLKITQGSPSGGGTIILASTGTYPTTTNVSTACTTMATNAAAVFNAQPQLGTYQGWATGGG